MKKQKSKVPYVVIFVECFARFQPATFASGRAGGESNLIADFRIIRIGGSQLQKLRFNYF